MSDVQAEVPYNFTSDTGANGLLYLQLETEIKQKVFEGKYPVGERIPTEAELCAEYGVSRITVRRAVQDLVEDGLLKKVRGRGTFVAVPKHVLGVKKPNERGFDQIDGGASPTRHALLDKGVQSATSILANCLGVREGEEILYVKRLFLENDFPLAIDWLMVPAKMFPGLLDLIGDEVSFYDLVENHYGYSFGMEDLIVDVSTARKDEGLLLKCPIGSPLFILRKSMRQADGSPLHYSRTVLRGDRVSYHFRVDRNGEVVNRGEEFALSLASRGASR